MFGRSKDNQTRVDQGGRALSREEIREFQRERTDTGGNPEWATAEQVREFDQGES